MMNKIKTILFTLSTVITLSLVPTSIQAKSPVDMPRENYKCYLDTNWIPQIGYFSWYPKDTRKNLAGLPGQKLPKSPMSRNRPLYIKKVIECVPETEDFSSTKAKKLESQFSDLG